MEVHFGKGLHNFEKDTLLDHELNFFLELQILQNLLHRGRIGLDELKEVGVQVITVTHKLLQRNALCIIERYIALALYHLFQLIRSHTFEFGSGLQDFFNGCIFVGKDAVKTADNCHGDNYITVFLRSVGTTGFICNTFYKIYFAVDISGKGHIIHSLFPRYHFRRAQAA